MGTWEEVEAFDCNTLDCVWSCEPLERLEPSETSETTLRTLCKKASGITEANTIQMDGKLTAMMATPSSRVVKKNSLLSWTIQRKRLPSGYLYLSKMRWGQTLTLHVGLVKRCSTS